MRLMPSLSVAAFAMATSGAFAAGSTAATDSTFVDQGTVREVQHVLRDRGFRTSADGIMGPRTQAAIRSFQKSHNLEPTGQLNRQTLVALGIQNPEAAKAEPQYSASVIRKVQQTLDNRGFKAGAVDGVLSSSTQSALRAFQKSENLQETGRLNPQTLAALGIPAESAASTEELAMNEPADVRDVQRKLNRLGYHAGRADGIMGRSTRMALMDFQRAENLQPTGQLNPQTLSALGLGETSASVGSSR